MSIVRSVEDARFPVNCQCLFVLPTDIKSVGIVIVSVIHGEVESTMNHESVAAPDNELPEP